ncbi:hypothetical protein EC957_000938 [Mortierella hygrophila]|uniref:WD40 repeat-like protein n=1 Tax=Mortierella hygrophila TaxID=979708 RepID=A0A9P6K2Y3_9FUNG|nr:hypothetical protein EC957_000938 [Mortierella hygrophila]
MSPPLLSTDANVAEILSCSLCTYSDVCLIPQAGIIVRTYRTRTGGPLMQVLDWALRHSIDLGPHRRDDSEMSAPDDNDESDGETETESMMEEEEEGHQDLISGMDVNDEGTLLVSCSIDGTIRVWDVLVTEFGGDACQRDSKGKGKKGNAAKEGQEFLEKVDKFGCPLRARRLLTGHVGWVNAVAVEDTTVVSGGSDHTVRIWDALSGTLLRLIPDLFTTRDLDLGVFSVAIRKPLCSTSTTNESGIIAVGTVIEGYQLFSLSTGDLIMELDEPLTSRQHTEFETETYQQYAAKVVITETVIVTNSKLRGMLCVWCRRTGELLYRIRICPTPLGKGSVENQRKRRRMVSCSLSESSRISSKPRRVQGDGEDEDEEEEVETIHTFKVNKSGSMLMCTLCDGRVALFEFGRSRRSATEKEVVVSMLDCFDSRLRSASDFGGVAVVGEDGDDVQQHIGHDQEQEHPPASSATGVATVESIVHDEQEGGEGEGACGGGGALAWIWSRDRRGDQRVVLV